jgi:hypothetical protein
MFFANHASTFANHASAPASIFFVVSVKPPLIALDEGDRVIGYFLLPFFGLQPTEIMKTTLPVEGDLYYCSARKMPKFAF